MHRHRFSGVLERYNTLDFSRIIRDWPGSYIYLEGNNFKYPEYNYLSHVIEDMKRQVFMCFDEYGDLRWAKFYESSIPNIVDITISGTADSGLVAFQMRRNPDRMREDLDAYFIKLDKYGNQERDWLSNGDPELVHLRDALILYPNPAQHTLTLANQNLYSTRGSIIIYDIQGAIVLERDFSPSIDVSQLSAGSYIYSLVPEQGPPLSEIFVVE